MCGKLVVIKTLLLIPCYSSILKRVYQGNNQTRSNSCGTTITFIHSHFFFFSLIASDSIATLEGCSQWWCFCLVEFGSCFATSSLRPSAKKKKKRLFFFFFFFLISLSFFFFFVYYKKKISRFFFNFWLS